MKEILKFFRLLSLLVVTFLIGSCVLNFKNNAAPFKIVNNFNVEQKKLFSNTAINENEEDKKNEKDKKNEEDDKTSTILVGVSFGVSIVLLILTIGTVVRELKK